MIKGPIPNDHLDYWKKHRVSGCKCNFCVGQWKLNNGYADEWDQRTGQYTGTLTTQCKYKSSTPASFGGWSFGEFTFVPTADKKWEPPKDAPPGGSVCRKCHERNQYAAPNQKDGSYICYGCR